jgi:nucleoside-diphosphate-sugar epimerase
MAYFIAGSTGYTGQALVKELRRRQLSCLAHIRPSSSSLESRRQEFTDLGAEVSTAEWTTEAMTECLTQFQPEVIFSVLGTTKKKNKLEARHGREASYDSIDRDLPLLLYSIACRLPAAPRFVFLSSMGAEKPTGTYLRARYEVEQVLINGSLPYLIARPGFISGSDRDESRPMERFATIGSDAMLRGLAALGMETAHRKYASLSSTQLAQGLIHFAIEDLSRKIVYSEDLRRS